MWTIRAALFLLDGTRKYTREAFQEKQTKYFDPTDLEVDLRGQTHMITGANQGIGLETARFLASRGAAVHMICRNQQRGEEAAQRIRDETGNSHVHLHVCDVSVLRDVARFAHGYAQSGQPLDVLIHNAGCMVDPLTLTDEGVEVNFATNVAGPALLTELLLPVLRRSPRARVVLVSSAGMYTEALEVDDLYFEKTKPFSGMRQYARNKRAQVALAERWAALPANSAVKFFSMHPGWADTEAARTKMAGLYRRYQGSFRTPRQGADTVIWLAASAAAGGLPSGCFVFDRQAVRTHLPLARTGYGAADVDRLWARLHGILRPYLAPAPVPSSEDAAGAGPAGR